MPSATAQRDKFPDNTAPAAAQSSRSVSKNYAFWRRCDFQVHTPRDPNWSGQRVIGIGDVDETTGQKATSVEVERARLNWANNFVDQCIAKGLEAVAITDHHEMVMLPYVQAVIAERKKNETAFDFWLFPGMELTAHGGKQCLILFDADLSEDWRRQAQSKLGIEYAGIDEERAQGPRVTQLPCNYAEIASFLEELEGLRGKFTILPNLSNGGRHTVLVEGGHADFRRMPYVGGYLDQGQTIDTLGTRNRRRLSGDDNTWSNRRIYPLPTSDSRSSDYSRLGANNTWIKLAAPTAEAVRQAFLSYQSRIAIDRPEVASLVSLSSKESQLSKKHFQPSHRKIRKKYPILTMRRSLMQSGSIPPNMSM